MIDLFGQEGMKALSWRQPYAWLMLPPYNKIETRTWGTTYRGPVLICVSKKAFTDKEVMDIAGEKQFSRICDLFGHNKPLNLGMAIAVGRLVDCRRMTPTDEDACFVEYLPTRWCHVYEDVRPIAPIPFTGRLSWTPLEEEFILKVKKRVLF
jgi:hypothetical protein